MRMSPEFDVEKLQKMDEQAWARLQEEYFRRIYFYVKALRPRPGHRRGA
jgi:hypothetical protein